MKSKEKHKKEHNHQTDKNLPELFPLKELNFRNLSELRKSVEEPIYVLYSFLFWHGSRHNSSFSENI